jgi:hypothetical protein
MQRLKIVVTGAFAAGKTNFIKAISEIEVVSTEEEVSHSSELEVKNQTTVALDFGKITISSDLALYLFGTPGQDRFDFMWDVLSEGCIGYVVLVDSTEPSQFEATRNIIRHFNAILDVPFVVAANKQDNPACLPVDYIRFRLGLPEYIPLLPCIATNKESVKEVLLGLLEVLLAESEEPALAS